MSPFAPFCCYYASRGLPCECSQLNTSYSVQQPQQQQYSPQYPPQRYPRQGTSHGQYASSSISMQHVPSYGNPSLQYSQGVPSQQPQTQGQGSGSFSPRGGYNEMWASQYTMAASPYGTSSQIPGAGGQSWSQQPIQEQSMADHNSMDCQNGSVPNDDPNRPRPNIPEPPPDAARPLQRIHDYQRDYVGNALRVIGDVDKSLAGSLGRRSRRS